METLSGTDRSAARAVAIVGMACRLPGAANVEQFWNLLHRGEDSVGHVPAERFDIDSLYDPRPGLPGRVVSRAGGYLERIDEFDAPFFDTSPREAIRLDPQLRLLLETSWEAVEDAGIPAERLAGSRTGVYVACQSPDYADRLREAGIRDLHAVTGSGIFAMPAGRISFALDLRGPSMSVSSTCSTSLLAVHLACQSIRTGESEMALVGGASLLLSAEGSVALSQAEALSPRGRCRFGDASADGYVRSEGVAAIVLKRLDQAIADGDRIHALVLGGGVTNDGRSGTSPISPGIAAQEEMLRLAYRDAGVSLRDVDYIEAHGTGTVAGDHAEFTALGNALLAAGRTPDRPCLVGSVKSNIGHVEVTAGLVGLVKTALSLRHGTVPATLHVEAPNPVLTPFPLQLARERWPWPRRDSPALAGVSSFGLSGTNVHLVLQQAPPAPELTNRPAAPPTFVLPLSARCPTSLRELAARYRAFLGSGEVELRDVCHSAGVRRTGHEVRAAVVAADSRSASEALGAFAAGGSPAGVAFSRERVHRRPRVAFVFSGQGAQSPGMGRELLAANDVFARTLAACDAAVQAELGWSVIERLSSGGELAGTDVVQPTLWAVAVSLAAVWRDYGIEPDLVIGHSMGEIAAATVSGALTIEDAAAVVCRRSRLLLSRSGMGGMASVQLGEHDALRAIAGREDVLSVAVCNGDDETVLSGDSDALADITASLHDRGVYCRKIAVDYASHGPQVEPLRNELLAELATIRPGPPRIPMHSTLHSRPVEGTELGAEYWMDNLRQPVRFGAAVRATLASGVPTLFIEISPHPLLVGAVQDAIERTQATAWSIASLRRGAADTGSLLGALGTAYTVGCSPAWERLDPGGRYVALPYYPWQRRRYWADGDQASAGAPPDAAPESAVSQSAVSQDTVSPDTVGLPPDATEVPLNAYPVGMVAAPSVTVREYMTSVADAPYLADCRIRGGALIPAGSYVDAVLTNVAELTGGQPAAVEALEHHEPLVLRGTEAAVLRVLLRTEGQSAWRFEVHSRRSAHGSVSSWTVHASGNVHALSACSTARREHVEQVRSWCREHADGRDFYRRIDPGAEHLGERLRTLREVWSREGEALGLIRYPQRLSHELAEHQLHPGLLEVCGQSLLAAVPDPIPLPQEPVVLDAAEEIRVLHPPTEWVWCHARLTALAEPCRGDVRVLDRHGRVAAEVRQLQVRPLWRHPGLAGLHRAMAAPAWAVRQAPPPPRSDPEAAFQVSPMPPSTESMQEYLSREVARVLQAAPDAVDLNVPLAAIGMDSLLAAELHGRIRQELGILLPVRQFLADGTLDGLARRACELLATAPAAPTAPTAPTGH